MKGSQSQRLDGPATDGQPCPKPCREPDEVVVSTCAQHALVCSDAVKSSVTTYAQSYQSLAGTASMVSSSDCSAHPTKSKSSASPVTKQKRRKKMPNDVKAPRNLAKRLRELLAEDKEREATRLIERLSPTVLGEHNFIYRNEAQALAAIDMKLLQDFINQVADIRAKLDLDYEDAASRLGEDDE